MGATGKEIPPLPARKGHAGGGVSLTWVGLNPNNWHVGVNPNYWYGCHGQRNTPPASAKGTLAGGFLSPGPDLGLLHPPSYPLTTWSKRAARTGLLIAARKIRTSNPRTRTDRKFSNRVTRGSRIVIQQIRSFTRPY